MIRYLTSLFILLIFFVFYFNRGNAQPQIGTYPPQIHQQICQGSTFTRYLFVFNPGDAPLLFNAVLAPDTVNWVSAQPLSGEIPPGDSMQIAFSFNSTGLAIENYFADLIISSNDPITPELMVLAMLHVQDLTIFLTPEADSICYGCSTRLNLIVFGCSEEYSFNWTSDPPGFSSTEKSPVVIPQVNTIYTVTVTDGNYSSDESVYIQVYGSADITENLISSQFSIFPNPTYDRFTIKLDSENEGQGHITICDFSGRIIFKREIELKKGTVKYGLDPGYLNPGIYLLSIEMENNVNKVVLFRNKLIVN